MWGFKVGFPSHPLFNPVTDAGAPHGVDGLDGDGSRGEHTMIFFNATNALGVDTTAITESSLVPSSNWLARRFAVSSEY